LATPEEVSEYLGVPIPTLYQWRYRGEGPRASKIGRHLRYDWADIETYVRQQAGERVA
jgi:excisionase family DNA binding protein